MGKQGQWPQFVQAHNHREGTDSPSDGPSITDDENTDGVTELEDENEGANVSNVQVEVRHNGLVLSCPTNDPTQSKAQMEMFFSNASLGKLRSMEHRHSRASQGFDDRWNGSGQDSALMIIA